MLSTNAKEIIVAYFQGGNAKELREGAIKEILQSIIEVVREEEKKSE